MNKQLSSVVILRESHIAIARMFARGLTKNEIRRRTGYSNRRLQQLYASPAFQDLIAHEAEGALEDMNEETDTFMELSRDVAMMAKWDQYDKLHELREMGEHLPIRESIALSADYADRFGYSKRAEVQHNHSFGELLDKAIERSNSAKLINGTIAPPSSGEVELKNQPHQFLPGKVVEFKSGDCPSKSEGVRKDFRRV